MKLRERCRGISLGVFAGDLGSLSQVADDVERLGCGMLHFDIMDGFFVPQMTGGAGFVKAIDCNMVKDIHLMVQNPASHVADYVAAGADIISVHAEANDAATAIDETRLAATKACREVLAGVSLMLGTSLEDAGHVLAKKPDLILVLALDPRDRTPANIAQACRRVETIRSQFPDSLVAFDGGVTQRTMPDIASVRPDIVVSGSAIMGAPDRAKAFQTLNSYM